MDMAMLITMAVTHAMDIANGLGPWAMAMCFGPCAMGQGYIAMAIAIAMGTPQSRTEFCPRHIYELSGH